MRCPRHPAVAQFSLAQRERTLNIKDMSGPVLSVDMKSFSSKSFFIIKRKYCKIQLQLERTSAIHNDCSEGDGAQNVFF